MAINNLPKGACLIWFGPMNKVPKGWAVCDGTNGTRDLRGNAGNIGATAYIVRV